jgi:hypothetical protein
MQTAGHGCDPIELPAILSGLSGRACREAGIDHTPGFNHISVNLIRIVFFVPEGLYDSSLARSAWKG